MLLKSAFFRLFCSLCLVFSLSVLSFADTIRLKDGSIIKGKIVNFTGGKFTVAVGEGSRRRQMSYSAEEIESIQFDAPPASAETVKISNQNVGAVNQNNSAENKIITVGQVNKTPSAAPPPVAEPDVSTPVNSTPNNIPNNPSVARAKPVELNVKVLADNTSNGWTNSGWVVKKGQRIRVSANGSISLGGNRMTTASGIADLADDGKLMKNVPTGALIVVIGDDNNEFIYIGAEREFTAARDGSLFLGVNEGNLNDNSGAFDVKIEIDSASGR